MDIKNEIKPEKVFKNKTSTKAFKTEIDAKKYNFRLRFLSICLSIKSN